MLDVSYDNEITKNMNMKILLFGGTLILLFLCCTDTFGQSSEDIKKELVYFPDNGNALPITKPKDLNISFDVHSNWDLHARVNVGYSPFSHFQVTAGLFHSIYTDIGQYRTKSLIPDIGVGTYYFFTIKNKYRKKNHVKKWMMDHGVLVNGKLGYSRGNINLVRGIKSHYGNFVFDKKYLQLGAHFQTNLLGASGIIRFGRLHYKSGTVRGLASEEQSHLVETLMQRNRYSFVESSIRLLIGTKFGQFNFGLVGVQVGPDLDKIHRPDYGTIGGVINIQDFLNHRRSKKK